jgi:Tfp pilus assembly protein PilN
MEDFYVQNFQSGKRSFISIIRKTDADKWLGALRENGYVPLSLSLGPFPVQNIIPQLNNYDSGLVFDGNTIIRNEEGDWLSWNYDQQVKAPFPLKVESEPIGERFLLAYAAAFQLILSDKIEQVIAHVPWLQGDFNEVTNGKKLRVYGSLLLAVFFVLLLINFVVFSSLKQSNDRLTAQVSQTITEQTIQKEALLDLLGWDGGINKTALVDQVASLMPAEITLDEISVNPIDIAKSRVQHVVSFSNRQIDIHGFAENIIPVNEWIARIKTRPWVKDIQLESYTFNNENNTGQFLITVKY